MHAPSRLKTGLMVIALSLASFASAQFGDKVTELGRVTLAQLQASSGNDCWGYVSATGREYALMGCNNKLAVIEITNPANPVIIKTISHTSSTWSDIKTYGNYAYSVTEASGTGIQVIYLGDVDNGNVTLVRTVTSPSRTHNIHVDTVNGFLYTCGSNGGTGTTMCFSLADPSNPVQVGPASMTTNYHHDGQLVSYTTGPMAGKQIWYGFSEGRGVDVYDFTDKANPVMIKRIVYPNMNYCHQGWISEDLKYLYVDDELDETGLGVNTRSLIFNVEDPVNGYFVGTFSTGLPAIDHNQYTDDGFTFQANYRSGLRIFDRMADPTAPVAVGFYDTYPADNNPNYNGAWSTYPYFPSGNVIISDMTTGFYVVNANQALTRTQFPFQGAVVGGTLFSGSISDLTGPDGVGMRLGYGTTRTPDGFPIGIDLDTRTFDGNPDKVKVTVVSSANVPGYSQVLEVFDWFHNVWVRFDQTALATAGMTRTFEITANVSNFVQPGTNMVRVGVRYQNDVRQVARLTVTLDQVKFEVLR